MGQLDLVTKKSSFFQHLRRYKDLDDEGCEEISSGFLVFFSNFVFK